MPKTRREAGVLALLGVVLMLLSGTTGDGQGFLLVGGVVVFAIGAVLWLIHYSHDLRKDPDDSAERR